MSDKEKAMREAFELIRWPAMTPFEVFCTGWKAAPQAECAHKFVPYYEGVQLCEKCKTTQAECGKSSGEAVAYYDGRSKEPALMWAFDGYKPAAHDVVLYTATGAECAPRALTDEEISKLEKECWGTLPTGRPFFDSTKFARAIEQAVKQKGG
jgi:hypothetical protein